MKEIILVRHGENIIDDDIPNDLLELTQEGINQAKEVSKILNNDFDVVISSTSKRAIDTAKNITDKELITDERLLEKGWYHNNGNETEEETIIRFKNLFKELETKYKDKRVLLITHGSFMRLAQNVIENKVITRERVNNCDIIKYINKNNSYIREV